MGARSGLLPVLAGLVLAGPCGAEQPPPEAATGYALQPPAEGRRFMAVTANPHATMMDAVNASSTWAASAEL